MYVKKINLINFRNYKKISVSFNKGINIIYGDNAQGKTNLLESIYVLGITNSHRNINENTLIRQNEFFFKVSGKLRERNFDKNLEVYVDNQKKVLMQDGEQIKKVSDYLSVMNIIIFTPDDLEIIKGSPQIRRNFLDIELSQLYSNYYIILNEYKKILKMRNEYLKNSIKNHNFDKNYFDIITSYLIDKAIIIIKMRSKFIDKINDYCKNIFFDITNKQNFCIKYKNNYDIDIKDDNLKEKILNKYQQKYDVELKLASTLYGPHKDDFEFYLDDINLKLYGSQGQQRISVLVLKLSEIEIFKKYKGSTPILLLDDIFSEIDDDKKNNLLNYISKDIQTIITTTDINYIDKKILSMAKIFNVQNGKIKKANEVINNE